MRLLLKHGANVNAEDESHNTPLHLALSQVSAETVWLLTQYGLVSMDRARKSSCSRQFNVRSLTRKPKRKLTRS